MFWNMLRIEQVKLFKRKLFWIELAMLAALIVASFVSIYFTRFSNEIPPEFQGELEAFLVLPGSLITILGLAAGDTLGGLMMIVLVGGLVAQEYSWRTFSTWLMRGTPRPLVLVSKMLVLLLAVIILVLMTLVVGGLVSAVFTLIINGSIDLSQIDVAQLAISWLRTAYSLLPYTALAFLLAIMTRSTVATIGLGVGYALVFESLAIQLMGLLGKPFSTISYYLPASLASIITSLNESIANLTIEVGRAEGGAAAASQIAELPEPGVAAIGIAVYTLVFVGIAVWRFRRQDITS